MSDELKFEKAIEALNQIVSALESGDIDLDEALKKYEEGVKLVRVCRDKLSKAEKKVEILTQQVDRSFVLTNLQAEDESFPKKRKRKNELGEE